MSLYLFKKTIALCHAVCHLFVQKILHVYGDAASKSRPMPIEKHSHNNYCIPLFTIFVFVI